jgi:uncharacterized protein
VDGKANEAVRRGLAAALGVRRADVVLRLGARGRNKVFSVSTSDVGALERRLVALRDGAG